MGLLQPLCMTPMVLLCWGENPEEPTGYVGRSPRTGPFPANTLGFQQCAASGLSALDVVSGLVLISLWGSSHFWRQAHRRRWKSLWDPHCSILQPCCTDQLISAVSSWQELLMLKIGTCIFSPVQQGHPALLGHGHAACPFPVLVCA